MLAARLRPGPARTSTGDVRWLLLSLLLLPTPILAQAEVVVDGRVYDAVTNGPVPNAIVTLEGHGSVLSNEQGTFRFTGVVPGAYLVRVEAFGYEDFAGTLPVLEAVTIELPLSAAPLQLDSVLVEAETIDFDRRVRDPLRDYNVKDAQVVSTQGHDERTDTGGRFDLDDVWAGAPLRVIIRSFGYLPLDTTFIPDDEERYEFDLHTDPVIARLIEDQNRRLEERAGENLYAYRAPMTRDDLVRFSGTGTLQTMMEAKYPLNVLRRVVCIVIDERQVPTRQRVFVLRNTLPENLERAELLEFFVEGARRLMLRAYTKTYFQGLIARNQPLQEAEMLVLNREWVCT